MLKRNRIALYCAARLLLAVRRTPLVLMLALLPASAASANTITLKFDSLPSAQGWTYLSGYGSGAPAETDVYSVDGTKLTQNTMGRGANFASYEMYGAIDPNQP